MTSVWSTTLATIPRVKSSVREMYFFSPPSSIWLCFTWICTPPGQAITWVLNIHNPTDKGQGLQGIWLYAIVECHLNEWFVLFCLDAIKGMSVKEIPDLVICYWCNLGLWALMLLIHHSWSCQKRKCQVDKLTFYIITAQRHFSDSPHLILQFVLIFHCFPYYHPSLGQHTLTCLTGILKPILEEFLKKILVRTSHFFHHWLAFSRAWGSTTFSRLPSHIQTPKLLVANRSSLTLMQTDFIPTPFPAEAFSQRAILMFFVFCECAQLKWLQQWPWQYQFSKQSPQF